MKKCLLILSLIAFSTLSANAGFVNYTPAGSVKKETDVEFGSNASFTPQNRIKAGQQKRFLQNEKSYYKQFENAHNININNSNNSNNSKTETSSKNSQPTSTVQEESTPTTKTVKPKTNNKPQTRNGVTYY